MALAGRKTAERADAVLAACLLFMLLATPVLAEPLPKYFISIRLVGNAGSNTQEHRGLLFDTRYALSGRYDLGFAYQLTDPQKIEMPSELEALSASGKLNGEATRQVCSLYALFHPLGRDRTLDYYLGGSLNLQILNIEDMSGDDYTIVADTPPALGITAKTGVNWFFHENIGLTVDAEAGSVFSDYTAEDKNTGLTADFASPEFVCLLSIGISFRF